MVLIINMIYLKLMDSPLNSNSWMGGKAFTLANSVFDPRLDEWLWLESIDGKDQRPV